MASDPRRVDNADLVVTSYSMAARSPWIAARVWDLVVLDEAQAIKNPGAEQARAVKALKGASRLALTGTARIAPGPRAAIPKRRVFGDDAPRRGGEA